MQKTKRITLISKIRNPQQDIAVGYDLVLTSGERI